MTFMDTTGIEIETGVVAGPEVDNLPPGGP
jgi:hypothetical protein